MEAKFFVFFSCFVVYCAGYRYWCPEPQQCGVNEELRCVFECPPEKTCKTRGIQYRCQEPTKKCEYKCVCKTDYYRNPIGECVSGKQCDKCNNRDFEFFTCGPECDNECSKLGVQSRTNCSIVNVVCNPKCYCEDGYARDDQDRCIPVSKCPKRPICKGENENYVTCKQTCPPEFCVSLVSRFNCTSEPPCQPGCACKSGYFRLDKDSPCKHVCECPEMKNSTQCQKKFCGENEEYVQCKKSCPPELCLSIGAEFKCPGDPRCIPGCACKSGFLRKEENSPCIAKSGCTKIKFH